MIRNYLLFVVPAFLAGLYLGYSGFAYPPIDIEEISRSTAQDNAILGQSVPQIYSEKSPPSVINGGRSVLITTTCHLEDGIILSYLMREFPTVHFIFDSPVIYTGGVPVEHDWDVVPCFSAEERFGR